MTFLRQEIICWVICGASSWVTGSVDSNYENKTKQENQLIVVLYDDSTGQKL